MSNEELRMKEAKAWLYSIQPCLNQLNLLLARIPDGVEVDIAVSDQSAHFIGGEKQTILNVDIKAQVAVV